LNLNESLSPTGTLVPCYHAAEWGWLDDGAELRSDPTKASVRLADNDISGDRVPVILMGGNDLDAAKRAPGVPTYHSAQDINAIVRDFTKWDDNPVSLQHFAQSMVRAYKMAMTPPYEPVMIAIDGGLYT